MTQNIVYRHFDLQSTIIFHLSFVISCKAQTP